VSQRYYIVLGEGVTIPDVERALAHTGLTLSSTVSPQVFTIDHKKCRLPPTAFNFTLPAMVRRQAD
jgi:hypothetical protein